MVIMIRAILFAVIVFLPEMTAVAAAPLRIVAIGASNTQGWYVGNQGAYPAKLQALLKAKGIDAQVINAGVPFDTTAGMLKRIDSDVPTGTDIVILQPGANDQHCGDGAPVAESFDQSDRLRRGDPPSLLRLRFHPPHGRRPCDDYCYLTTEDHGNHQPSAQ